MNFEYKNYNIKYFRDGIECAGRYYSYTCRLRNGVEVYFSDVEEAIGYIDTVA
jgi:hypothetical protein